MSGNAPASQRSWFSYVLAGAAMVIGGLLAVMAPYYATIATSTIFGLVLAGAGAVCVVQALMAKEQDGVNWRLLLGATEVVGGIFIVLSPLKGAAAITLIIAIIVGGLAVTQAGYALRLRPAKGWGWLMIASLASLLIAVSLVTRFPFSLTESPGAMAGISLIFGGLAYVMVGLGRRETYAAEAA